MYAADQSVVQPFDDTRGPSRGFHHENGPPPADYRYEPVEDFNPSGAEIEMTSEAVADLIEDIKIRVGVQCAVGLKLVHEWSALPGDRKPVRRSTWRGMVYTYGATPENPVAEGEDVETVAQLLADRAVAALDEARTVSIARECMGVKGVA